jgi:UDP-N-acetylglucosamine acyltransferase
MGRQLLYPIFETSHCDTTTSMSIHPTAVIDPKAEIDSDVTIGHYVVIEGPIKVKRGSRIMAHAYLTGWTEIGENLVLC